MMTYLALTSFLLAALGHGSGAQVPAAAPFVYHGAGFTLTLPAGSAVRHGDDCPGALLVQPAPRRTGQSASMRLQFCIQTFANASRRPLAAWVDSARVERNRALDPDLAQLDPAKPVRVGSVTGLELLPFCGDCDAREVYLTRDGRVVEIDYHLGIDLVGSQKAQERRHRAVLATFRWTR
jgi:hypothetical protein